ncbi:MULTISPECIES: helix-turn-helix domain-containing protein [unclassified Streptomyces]|uniref:helix-turn-helix domain-containing protein n=1 Tax=unclassified Streptomyces TaxID=2593676 RepID=UPI0035E3534D
MTGAPTVAQRRTQVRQLAQDGASNRAIAAKLGISKDTVRRDLATPEAPTETLAQRLAQRAAQTESAMSQLSAAAQAVADAKPAYTPVDEETARRWHAELRATAARLAAHADEFADYYPSATTCATETASAP